MRHIPVSPWLLAPVLAWALVARSAQAQGRLFAPDTALPVTIRTDLKALLRDRDSTTAPWRDATLGYAGDSGAVRVPLKVRTRGIFRLGHCDMPPVRLRFTDSTARGTLFHKARRPKLVNPCRNDDQYEQYVLEEYAIYRMLRLFTPISLGARLLRVTWEDSAGRARPITRYAFITEDPARLAERLDATQLEAIGTQLGDVSRAHLALVGVFEYLIGNTDWSARGVHNILLLRIRDTTYTVPFDFDWSGVINVPYAYPARVLKTRSVRERVYRGYCQAAADFDPVLDRFVALRDSITALYRAVPGLHPRELGQTLGYYNGFYGDIRDHAHFVRDIVTGDCLQ